MDTVWPWHTEMSHEEYVALYRLTDLLSYPHNP